MFGRADLEIARCFDIDLLDNAVIDDERETLQPEVVQHEPSEALFAGEDGLSVVRRIIEQAPAALKTGAFIAIEVDPSQCEAVASLLIAGGFQATTVKRDLNGNERIVEAVLGMPIK